MNIRVLGGWIALLFLPLGALGGGREDRSVFSKNNVVRSSHFEVNHEDPLVPAGVLNTLEGLHAKLLLDLGPFSPWAYQEAIRVYLYHDGASYSSHTGMPPYMSAHINVAEKSIYGYAGADFQRVLAHELAHLYFCQFFNEKSVVPPLWLNEGVAMMMEWEYGMESDQKAMDRQIREEGPIPFGRFFSYSYAHAGPGDGQAVGLWYLQAQSVTRYLMRGFSQAQFVQFCRFLREGNPIDKALSLAYGLAVNNSGDLERLWLSQLAAGAGR